MSSCCEKSALALGVLARGECGALRDYGTWRTTSIRLLWFVALTDVAADWLLWFMGQSARCRSER